MQISKSEHAAGPWVITGLVPDFTLLDVWALPAEGEANELDALLACLAGIDIAGDAGSRLSAALFRIRLALGRGLGWDDPGKRRTVPGTTEASLRERIPDHLRGSPAHAVIGGALERAGGGFVPLYRTENEWAAEISNDTVHGVLHLSWAPKDNGRYGGRLAVYVKTRGALGAAYLALIKPFRHVVVYPALLRRVGRAWEARPRDGGRRDTPADTSVAGSHEPATDERR